jgi:hypothetical protein
MLSGLYMVINQLIRFMWHVAHLEKYLLYMLGKKYSSKKKWPKLGLENKAQIWSFKSP